AIQRQPMLSEEMQPQESLETNSSIKERVDFPTQPMQAKLKIGALVQTKQLLQCKSDRIQPLDNIESRLNKSKGGRSPLSSNVRGFIEPRLKTNLKNVRVHTNSEAVQMSRELSAEAFTHGSDIYYGSGKSPGNNELTADELTHVMQQTGAVQSQYNLQKTSLIQLTGETKKQKTSGNSSVKDIQRKLNKIGVHPALKIDGIFGGLTRQAVCNFQEDHRDSKGKKLKLTGIVNDLTKQAIDKASNLAKASDSVPKPLAADELILTTDPKDADPKDANERSLFRFRTQVGSKLVSWQHHFDAYMVQLKPILFGSEEKQAIILKWNTSWGTKPISTYIPYDTMAPIDAKASVASVHKLPGWSKLDSSEQTILNSMLGGETNQLSQKSRDNLRGKLSAMSSSYNDTQQEKALRELITAKDSIPKYANEVVNTTKVKYDLAQPAKQKDYQFNGVVADAESWLVTFDDYTELTIFTPKAPTPGYHNHTVQQTADAVSYVPKVNRSLINIIILNPILNPSDPYWADVYKQPNLQSYMSATAEGVMYIYPEKETKPLNPQNYMRGSMIHETGHTWSYQNWGADTSQGKWLEWKKMMDADKVSVSGYAMAKIIEDVAETIRVYFSTQGTPSFDEYRQIVPNRFAMLDREYK
ncbi:DUF4157 domain-containing protein, partial [Nostoc sp. NMS4]|uniref:eCIS core domain-containing protein n=1 Tax=Nostoc sp. NMS4 TaxID=2815390 RepID=UPI0026013B56